MYRVQRINWGSLVRQNNFEVEMNLILLSSVFHGKNYLARRKSNQLTPAPVINITGRALRDTH